MPGPVSDSYDPEFSTAENARIVRQAIINVRDTKITPRLGEELKYILDVIYGKSGRLHSILLSEKELRIIRFALNRAIDETF